MNSINGEKQEQSYKDVVISKYSEAFLKKDYCFFDNKTRGRNLMWCNFARERDRIIATEELEKVELQDKKGLFFYLERTEELYIADYEEICKYVSSLEPWEEIDAVIFDKTLEWTIAVTHEDISILMGVDINMSMVFEFIPYRRVGKLVFGMSRKEVKEIYGESTSSCMYGYPVEDRFLDDYGYMHTLCSNRELLEGVELFPDISPETLILKYDQVEILLTKEPGDLVDQLIKITDDLIKDEDEEGYSSKKLGLKIYCPDDIVENVILHDLHCYDEEEEFMEEQDMEV